MITNKDTIAQLAKENKRLDGRELTDYREPIKVDFDISWTAEGSARVQIGETVVLAGVKTEISKPYDDTPDQGGFMVNAELLPLSSPDYESGPPGIKAVELARVTDRGIRESHAIDLKKLCIEEREKAWTIIIDIITINDAGNLFDAAGLAALAALKTAKFPTVDEETGIIDYKNKSEESIPVNKSPIAITVYKINGKMLVDPSIDEEKSYDARITISSDETGIISAIQKGGATPMTYDEIAEASEIAIEKAKFLREKLNLALK